MASQPVFEAHTARDVKYPSYRGRKAAKDLGLHFEVAGAADTSAPNDSFLSWCNSAMSQAPTDSESPGTAHPLPQEPNPIWSGPATPPPPTVWNTLSRVPRHRQGRQNSPYFLLHNSISSNQQHINQRHLIQSEWI